MPAEKPLPNPNVDPTGRAPGEMTEESIRAYFCNPVYAGVGPYPAIIDDETWIRAAAKALRQDGAEQWLVNMLYSLRASLKAAEEL